MTGSAFVFRGLRYFRSSYFGVVLAATLGAMVLLGALFAGDSVKGTLRKVAENRTGTVARVVVGGENFFRSALEEEVEGSAAVMLLRGQVDEAAGRSVGQVELYGVTPAFWEFSREPMTAPELGEREWAINRALSRSLSLEVGETLVIRLKRPGFVSRDAPMSGESDALSILRGTVGRIVEDGEMGGFGLAASQLPVPKVFLPLARLQEKVELPAKANLLLLGEDSGDWESALKLPDYGLSLQEVPLAGALEVRTDRVFLNERVAAKVRAAFPQAEAVLTYLSTTVAGGESETPYSMVTGVDPETVDFLPDDLAEGEVVLNEWIAEDLQASVGDEVRVSYFTMGLGNSLLEETRKFSVRAIVPLEGLAGDRLWMPNFPGVAEVEDSVDWSPGMPLDMERIRDKDEEYWDNHRGTPKAFVTLAAGQGMWGNRWGEATSLRIPNGEVAAVTAALANSLKPSDGGLQMRALSEEARAASKSPVDIAMLFMSMSFFLIVAAVALTAMLFRFGIEQRNRESGLLAAVGVPASKVLRWRLSEGLVAVLIGCVLGGILALLYTQGLLIFLEQIWNEEGGERFFDFHAHLGTAIGGLVGFVVLVMGVIWMVTRKQARQSASLRLEAGTEELVRGGRSRAHWVGLICAVLGSVALVLGAKTSPQGTFFGAGFLFLVAGLSFYRWRLRRKVASSDEALTAGRLADLNSGRRGMRSLVVVGSLAAGVFLVVSVSAFQKHGGEEWRERASGAGGFAYWLETTGAVNRGDSDGVEADYFGLGDEQNMLGKVIPMRVGAGDDASCFNLNTVARPRLLATEGKSLAELEAFSIKAVADGLEPNWNALAGGEVMRAFVDENTLLWVLKKKLGDRLAYVDEWGEPFEIELAGILPGSIFQGNLVVEEARFLTHFPGAEGYRLFLVEDGGDLEGGRALLQKALADRGAQVTTTKERLAAFHGVENTYIAIFNVLGGLGVILGSAGLGLVTARNLAERKSEFAIMHTLGIPGKVTRAVVFREVRQFIAWGLGIGLVSALVSIVPHLQALGVVATLPWIVVLVGVIALNAWFWSWLGFRRSLRAAHEAREEFV